MKSIIDILPQHHKSNQHIPNEIKIFNHDKTIHNRKS